MNGKLFDIQRGSFVDGPGIRTTVFSKAVISAAAGVITPRGAQIIPSVCGTQQNVSAA